ncbi:hypothetical protein [Prolixibacter sp. SD074]|jgi:hypothetical protein|uniref:hypothetical protein n=1 Tax=Prolixibacter sp. SD074 TaxID=2652391 RepID=UPI00127DEB9C|nr:hypothetical protein [Prolixibacter sp. SD074]GET28509.1 hypothetical protein SD074_07110 [Prolixibacter sp. SD074]
MLFIKCNDYFRIDINQKNATTRFLMVIIGFSGLQGTEEAMKLAVDLLARYGKAGNIEQWIVR